MRDLYSYGKVMCMNTRKIFIQELMEKENWHIRNEEIIEELLRFMHLEDNLFC